MDKETLIKKWLNDALTPAEKEEFEQGEDFVWYQSILSNAKYFKASHVSEPKSFEDFKSIYSTGNSNSKTLSWFRPLLRIASVVVIAFAVYFSFFYNNLIQVQTLASQKTTLVLPDQSKVTLNADSEVEYNENDWDNHRRLNLEGEAYFKVAKGKTFDVITSQGIVTVVGTEFNIKQRHNYFEVQCFEGIVNVTSGDISKQLLAGDTYRLLKNKFSQDRTTHLEPQWIQNKSTFKIVPFKSVIDEVERQFDIEIMVENVNTERLFTGGFLHNNIENALLSITQPMDLTYKTNASNQVVIYGNKK
ncbi:anti-sigma factor [Flavobacteriales bacterium 33_180_T64]|nr:anti-sigma factor [Flavobacteriales bacterium 33_180_T64]